MERSVYDITLDLQATHSRAAVTVKRFDTHRRLRFRLVSGGRAYPLTEDCYAVFTAQKPDGTEIFNHCPREEDYFLYDMTPQTTAVPGLMNCELRLYGENNALLTAAAFPITVADTVYPTGDGAITSTGEATALTQLVSQAGERLAQLGDVAAFKGSTAAALETLEAADQAQAARLDTLEDGLAGMEAQVAAQVAAMEKAAEETAAALTASVDEKAAALAEEVSAKTTRLEQAVAERIAKVAVIDDTAAGPDAWSGRKITRDRASAIVEQASGSCVAAQDSAEAPLAGLTLCGKTTQNGVPTPNAPVALEHGGSGGSIAVTVAGKNLLDDSLLRGASGITQADGVFSATASTFYAHTKDGKLTPNPFAEGAQYVFSAYAKKDSAAATPYLRLMHTDGTGKSADIQATGELALVTVVSDPGKTVDFVYVAYGDGGGSILSLRDMQLERGAAPTAYESYTAQTLTVATPQGLPGVPVASGGNYTDETGQQWVCDTVDLGRGVLTKRLARVDLGSLTWNYNQSTGRFTSSKLSSAPKLKAAGVCTHLSVASKDYRSLGDNEMVVFDRAFSSSPICVVRCDGITDSAAFQEKMRGATLLYELEQPIETALSGEEIAAFRALHTNYPNTTVLNDAGAGLQLSYVADTKTYIDQRIGALVSAILSTGGNV